MDMAYWLEQTEAEMGSDMKLRTVGLVLALGLLAVPLAADAQQPRKVYRIGVINETVQPNPPGQGPFYDRMPEEVKKGGIIIPDTAGP
jgi:ABC-type sugar transport system substrate-binding protein